MEISYILKAFICLAFMSYGVYCFLEKLFPITRTKYFFVSYIGTSKATGDLLNGSAAVSAERGFVNRRHFVEYVNKYSEVTDSGIVSIVRISEKEYREFDR